MAGHYAVSAIQVAYHLLPLVSNLFSILEILILRI